MITKRQLIGGGALAACGAVPGLLAGCAGTQGAPGFVAAKDIAEAGFIYGLPIVMNYGVMYEFAIDKNGTQFKAPFNTIKNESNVATYKDTAVVTPNSDTPYSLAWLDLRAEPMVISVPAIDRRRYYSVQLCDGNTYNYGYIGTRTTGTEAGNYLVVGPEWNGATPADIKQVFRSGTRLSIAIFRTQLFDPADIGNVRKVQAGYHVQPLSAWMNKPAPPAAPVIDFPVINKQLATENFFEYLDFALQFAPAAPNEAAIRAQLATIGVGPGKTFAFKDLPVEKKAEILLGMKQGKSRVDDAVAKAGTVVNGWNISGLPGDAAHYDGDWLGRAVAAQAGIYGNSPEEATYPFTRRDATGAALDGSANNYTITFPAGQLPPVDAFWSLTMYDGNTQLLIKNPINRYLINSPMLAHMKKNADGSLTIRIQHKSPGRVREPNWLPAPAGPIYLVMRLYWPKKTPPSILPPGKGTWAPPAVVRAAA